MLNAEDLAYALPNGRQLFSGVTMTLGPGEAVAVEGPSGVGKSTLLGVIGGLLRATSGTVRLEPGIDRRSFAWILQGLNCLVARPVIDNAMLDSLVDGDSRAAARERAASHLDVLGLGAANHQRARRLSGGELQRVAAARVLTSRRPIVLADEPTNQLDSRNARIVMRLLTQETANNRAVLIVTHDHDAVAGLCRVLRLGPEGLSG